MNAVAGNLTRRVMDGAKVEARRRRSQFREHAFGIVPGSRNPSMHGRIGIEYPPPVTVQRPVALILGQHAEEIGMEFGIEGREPGAEGPFELRAGPEEGGAEDDAEHPSRMAFGIGQGQRRAPGAAGQQSPVDAEGLANSLHVRHEMGHGVGGAAARGGAATGAALVEQHDAEARRIEQGAVRWRMERPSVSPGCSSAKPSRYQGAFPGAANASISRPEGPPPGRRGSKGSSRRTGIRLTRSGFSTLKILFDFKTCSTRSCA